MDMYIDRHGQDDLVVALEYPRDVRESSIRLIQDSSA
ncbi:hypothetical protein [Natrialba sp. SSL1]